MYWFALHLAFVGFSLLYYHFFLQYSQIIEISIVGVHPSMYYCNLCKIVCADLTLCLFEFIESDTSILCPDTDPAGVVTVGYHAESTIQQTHICESCFSDIDDHHNTSI